MSDLRETCSCGATFTLTDIETRAGFAAKDAETWRKTHKHAESVGICGDQPPAFDPPFDNSPRPFCELKAGHAGMHSDGEGHWTANPPEAAEVPFSWPNGCSTDSGTFSATMRAGDLTPEHIGLRVLGVKEVQGWAPHMVLHGIEDNYDGEGKPMLYWRWDDDPAPTNTHRGQFACGQTVDPDLMVTVETPTFRAATAKTPDPATAQVPQPNPEETP